MNETAHGLSDDAVLEHFGYQPELRRVLKSFSSFAIVFSFISISTGIFATYGIVINGAGPLGIWSWPLVCVGQIIIALVIAACAGRIPISGLSYQWMSRLTHPSLGWYLGWAFLGYGLITAPVVNLILVGTISQLTGTTFTSTQTSLIVIGITVIQAAVLAASTRATARVNNVAVWTELSSVAVFGLVLVVIGLVSAKHGGGVSSLSSKEPVGPSGYWYIFGPFFGTVLLGAFTFTGFDSAAALADETQRPYDAVPRGIIRATVLSAVWGMLFLLGITLAAPGDWKAVGGAASPVGFVAQNRLGTALGDVVIVFVMVAIWANSLIQTTVASRLIWAISRDGRFPFSHFFHRVHPKWNTPITAIGLATVIEIVIASIFTKLTDLIAASALIPVGVYLVVTLAYIVGRHRFPVQPGGFSLGRFDLPVALAAVVWSIVLIVLLIGPPANHKSAWIAGTIFASGVVWWLALRVFAPERLQAPIGEARAGVATVEEARGLSTQT
jgi:amino acid transporter